MSEETNKEGSEMLAEYDFSEGMIGKYAEQYATETNVELVDPDVPTVLPDQKLLIKAAFDNSNYSTSVSPICL